MAKKFGITKDTKSENSIKLFPPTKMEAATEEYPNKWKFPKVRLVNIIYDDNFETKNGITTVLKFIFVDAEKRSYMHHEFKIDEDDEHFDTKMEGMQVRINHIFANVLGKKYFPSKGIGTEAESFEDFFKDVQVSFEASKVKDGEGENAKEVPLYTKSVCYIKVVYYNGNLNFPLSPNFLQRAVKGVPCKLEVNLKYDTVEQKENKTTIPGGAGAAGEDIPDLGSGGGYDDEFE